MSAGRITQNMHAAAAQSRAAFIPFITGGYPDFAVSLELIKLLDQCGADVIEVGIPFSDPLADGPVIQRSSQLALAAGATPAGVLDMVAQAAPQVDAALVIMTYYNPVLKAGLGTFAARAASAGVSGLIIPDLPPEEAGPWLDASQAQGLDTIFMAAPTTPRDRLEYVLRCCRGFLYYVTMTGVTGSDLDLDQGLVGQLDQVCAVSPLPVAAGFGIAGPRQAAPLARAADGVIVGSALVKCLLEAENPSKGMAAVRDLASDLRASLAR